MNFYCDICEKTIKLKSKNNHFESLTHIQYETSFRIKHTIQNPKFFDVDKLFSDSISDHNKKFDLYLVKCDFKIVFNNFTPHFKTNICHDTSFINLKESIMLD